MNIVQFKLSEIIEIDGEMFMIRYNERWGDYELKECDVDGVLLDG